MFQDATKGTHTQESMRKATTVITNPVAMGFSVQEAPFCTTARTADERQLATNPDTCAHPWPRPNSPHRDGPNRRRW
jgi:hypothetical protein